MGEGRGKMGGEEGEGVAEAGGGSGWAGRA
jgi:hypothetical protein